MESMAETVRADARRNRERIVAAASSCFAAEGMECQMSVIAKAAGVGNATVFRHFPAKADLARAVMEQRMAETEALIREASQDEDATAGVVRMLEHFVESMVADRGLKQAAMGEAFAQDEELIRRRDEMFDLVAETVERGKAQGGIKPDVEFLDLVVLSQGVAHAAGPLELSAPGGWRRFLAVALRGVLVDDEAPLPPSPAVDPVSAAENH
jgi:AcrR family transcriptional regulator